MTTAIVTDSTTSVPPEVQDRPDVCIVPLTFHFGTQESYRDKVDMSNADFYERLQDTQEFPTTSQPPAGAFVEAYETLSAYDNLLVLTISSKLSGTFRSAEQAAGMVDRPVDVVDTRSAEMGSGLILLEALRVIDGGGDFKDVRRTVDSAILGCNVLFAVQTLDYLERLGRIGRAQRLVGTALDIRPVLSVEDGEVVPHKRTRGRKRQMATIVEEAKEAASAGRPLYFGHVNSPDAVTDLARALGKRPKYVAEIGGVVGSHVGPGAYGLAFL